MKQMPKDTILLISEYKKESTAYAWNYFKNYFDSPSVTYSAIYYKAGNDRNTWIDYKKTIQTKQGNREEKIRQALADKSFHINYLDIPDTYYYDECGIRSYYTPYDGYYDNQMWLQRDDMDLNKDAINRDFIKNITDQSQYIIYYWSGEDLVVKFPGNIKDAIISLNMFFYKYEISTSDTIIYRKIKQNLSKQYGFDETADKVYDLRFNVYRWKNLKKEGIYFPKSIINNEKYFVMPMEMEHNSFVFYNGVFYTYEIHPTNKNWIKINGLEAGLVDDLSEISVHVMKSSDKNMEAQMYVHCGVNNRYKNSVDFLLPVSNSVIVYNGVDHEYSVEDDNAIAYQNSTYSIYESVTYLSEVLSVNFTKVR